MMASGSFVKFTLFATLILAGCAKPAAEPERVRPVQALKVGDLKAVSGRAFPGRAKARFEVDLSFNVSGQLATLPVDVGSAVKKDDVIATIDPKDYRAAYDSAMGNLARAQAQLVAMQKGARPEELEQLKAAVDSAEATFRQASAEHDRYTELLKKKAASQGDFDISLARRDRQAAGLKAAKEDLNIGKNGARQEDIDAKQAEIRSLQGAAANARNQLEDTVLKSPFDGKVVARYVDNFQTVQAKQTIVRVLDDSKIEIVIQVPESLISLMPQVKEAKCQFDALADHEFTGKVTKIGSEASQTTRTYPVTIELEQPKDRKILPGMSAVVHVSVDSRPDGDGKAIIVPSSAILPAEAAKSAAVWIVGQGDKVTRRAIKTGKLTDAGVVVTDGLKAGDVVVTAGVHSLRENQEVKLLKESGVTP